MKWVGAGLYLAQSLKLCINCKAYQQILIYHTDFLPRLDDIQGVFLQNGEGRITCNNLEALTELVHAQYFPGVPNCGKARETCSLLFEKLYF